MNRTDIDNEQLNRLDECIGTMNDAQGIFDKHCQGTDKYKNVPVLFKILTNAWRVFIQVAMTLPVAKLPVRPRLVKDSLCSFLVNVVLSAKTNEALNEREGITKENYRALNTYLMLCLSITADYYINLLLDEEHSDEIDIDLITDLFTNDPFALLRKAHNDCNAPDTIPGVSVAILITMVRIHHDDDEKAVSDALGLDGINVDDLFDKASLTGDIPGPGVRQWVAERFNRSVS